MLTERTLGAAVMHAIALGDVDHDGLGDIFANLGTASAIVSGLPSGDFYYTDLRPAARQVFEVTTGNRPILITPVPDLDGDGVDEMLVSAAPGDLVLGSAAGAYMDESAWPILLELPVRAEEGAVALDGITGPSVVIEANEDGNWLRMSLR